VVASPEIVKEHPCPTSWDGTFYPAAFSRHLECFLDFNPVNNDLYNLRLHRINVTIHPTKTKGVVNIDFDLSSRHRNLTMPPPGDQPCGTARHDITCHLSQCSFQTREASGYYQCPTANCTSCGENANFTGCSQVLGEYVKNIHGPMQFVFDSPDGGNNGTSSATLYFGVLNMGIQCSTGTCPYASCEDMACMHGHCIEAAEGSTCLCDEGWAGRQCDTRLD